MTQKQGTTLTSNWFSDQQQTLFPKKKSEPM